MISHRTIAVIKREARSQIATRTFVIATIALPLMMFLLMAFMLTLGSVENSDETHITLVTNDPELEQPLKQLLNDYNFVQSGQYTIDYRQLDVDQFEDFLTAEKQLLLQDNNRGVIYIPPRAIGDKNIRFYSANPQNADVRQKIGSVVNAVLNRNYFRDKAINVADLDFMQKDTLIEGIRITRDGTSGENFGNLLVASVFVCLLMIGILFVASPVPGVIIGEKANRVAELLVSSMTAQELFTGKLIAGTLTGLFQMAIWLASFALLIWITTGYHSAAG